jgi:hypothetical protein
VFGKAGPLGLAESGYNRTNPLMNGLDHRPLHVWRHGTALPQPSRVFST